MRLAIVLAFCLVAADPPEPAVDGKSLTGWEGSDRHWKAFDGAIVGTSDGKLEHNTFLATKRRYRDFEMTFQVRLKNGIGNSGLQFRSELFQRDGWRVKGPQADICDKHYGSLYGENFGGMMQDADHERIRPTLRLDDFNDYSVRAVGKKVTIKVNGVVAVDKEFDKLPPEGIIALQLHTGPAMEVAFKNIKIKELK